MAGHWAAIGAGAAMCAVLIAQLWFGATPRVDRHSFIPFLDERPDWWEFFTWRDECAWLFWLGIGMQAVFMGLVWSMLFIDGVI